MHSFRARCKNRYISKTFTIAGGLLIYDNEGIFCIKEKKYDNIVYNDIGGKYQFEDGDIFATIAREFAEETYYCCEVTRRHLVSLLNEPGVVQIYLENPEKKPIYLCLIVPCRLLDIDISSNLDQFKEARCRVLENNPKVPVSYYSSLDMCHVSYTYLKENITDNTKIHFRLSAVLKKWCPNFFNECKLDGLDISRLSLSDSDSNTPPDNQNHL
jgi:hypothetical protein